MLSSAGSTDIVESVEAMGWAPGLTIVVVAQPKAMKARAMQLPQITIRVERNVVTSGWLPSKENAASDLDVRSLVLACDP